MKLRHELNDDDSHDGSQKLAQTATTEQNLKHRRKTRIKRSDANEDNVSVTTDNSDDQTDKSNFLTRNWRVIGFGLIVGFVFVAVGVLFPPAAALLAFMAAGPVLAWAGAAGAGIALGVIAVVAALLSTLVAKGAVATVHYLGSNNDNDPDDGEELEFQDNEGPTKPSVRVSTLNRGYAYNAGLKLNESGELDDEDAEVDLTTSNARLHKLFPPAAKTVAAPTANPQRIPTPPLPLMKPKAKDTDDEALEDTHHSLSTPPV